MDCVFVKDVIEISNDHHGNGALFNCDGEVFHYDSSVNNIIRCGTDEQVKLKDYKDKYFFTGTWYRGGKKCRECENRKCGLDSKFFEYTL